MSATRKTYIAVAEKLNGGLARIAADVDGAVNDTLKEAHEERFAGFEYAAILVADALGADNAAFDRFRFLAAVHHDVPEVLGR